MTTFSNLNVGDVFTFANDQSQYLKTGIRTYRRADSAFNHVCRGWVCVAFVASWS